MNNNTRSFPRTINEAFPNTSEYSTWVEGPYSRTKDWVWAVLTVALCVAVFVAAAYFNAA